MWKTMDKRKKMVSFLVLVLSVFNLLIADVTTVKKIAEKTTETYSVLGENLSAKKIKHTTLDTAFVPVQKELTKIGLCGTFHLSPQDTLSYSVENEEGKEVFSKTKVLAEKVFDTQDERIEIKLSDVTFEAGETYYLKVTFDLAEKAELSMDKNGIVNVQEYPVSHKGFLYAALVGVNLLAVLFLFLILKYGFSDRIFWGLTLTMGLLASVVSIPFARDDEFRHFIRVYDLATQGENYYYGAAPAEIYGVREAGENQEAPYVKVPAELDEMRRLAHENNIGSNGYHAETNDSLCIPKLFCMLKNSPKEGEVWVSAAGVWGRPLIAYLPQVVMVWLGNLFGARMFLLYLLAKAGQVLAVSFLYYVAWRLIPKYKYLIAAVALVPHSVVLYASCNSDGLMIAAVMLGIAMVLYAKEKAISLKTPKEILYWGMFLFLQSAVFLTKMPYVLIGVGLLPILFFRKWKKKEWILFGLLCMLAVVILWVKRDLVFSLEQALLQHQHFLFWKEHIVEVTNRLLHKGWSLLRETNTILRENSVVSYVGVCVVAALLTEKSTKWKEKIYILFLFLVMLGVIVVYGYILSPKDSEIIFGVSYRYLLPMLPLFLFALPVGNEKTKNAVALIFPLCLTSMVFAAMFTFGLF